MTVFELLDRAKALNENPYYVAYALVTGVASAKEAYARDGYTFPFIEWNSKVWDEQARREKCHRDFVSVMPGADGRHLELLVEKINGGKSNE